MSEIDSIQHTGEQAVDTVVGGGALALDIVRRPRTSARRAQKRGAAVTAEASSQLNKAVDTTLGLPERALTTSLRQVKRRATRKDVVGVAARALLKAVNAPAAEAAGFFTRIEKETTLPKRARRAASTSSRTGVTRNTKRNAKAAARTTGRTVKAVARGNVRTTSTTRGTRGRAAARRSA